MRSFILRSLRPNVWISILVLCACAGLLSACAANGRTNAEQSRQAESNKEPAADSSAKPREQKQETAVVSRELEPAYGSGRAASTFVGAHGQLSVQKGKLVDAAGKPVQLKGISSHGLQWYGQYVNKKSMMWLRDDWGLNVFRVAMYTNEGGYIQDPSVKKKVKEAVDAAVELGIYVIVDWHILSDGDPNTYKTQSKAFFKEMAKAYGNKPNIIYEIANEPNGSVTWSGQIKPYAEDVIQTIRAEDPDNLIVVGTGTWSQDIQDAAASPLKASNVLYAVHFYAGTHGAWLRDRIDAAQAKGLAVFVSEWGTSDASGNGGPYLDKAKEWTDFMDKRGIGWINWSLADKQEASAALKPGASVSGGWTKSQLSESGKFVRERMLSGAKSSTAVPASPTQPATPSPKPPAPAVPGDPADSGGSGTSGLTLLYRNLDDNPSDNALRPVFNIRNDGASAVNLKNVKIRYYYTNEGGVKQNYFCDWAQIGASNVKASFGRTLGAPKGAADYVELSFVSGSVPAGGESGEIQSRIHKEDWSSYDETDDYSYKDGQLQFGTWSRVVLTVGGKVVYGKQP
ncbi:cellulase family glycosylhydrolase [Saccharibacillus sp. CPCC 101409]|uniref:cellulase family glycosylhydrolase n=1 Tax=Saccharibacillus sp. CPCC 101409 TaxID=3058041 RepID=UPI0026733D24|nr:cellulase family glycosylhydrolase [Saccharibacillus sp. CPCC 101409]MDO3411725.1 cellulase family glycosylhydrolase [Saccharibacillus sp. CPCC 101409]